MCFLYNCASVLLQSFLQMFVLHLFDSRYAGSLRICLTWQEFLCCACYKKGNKTKIEVNLLLARTQKCFSVFVHDVLPAWNCESPAGKIIMTFCLIFFIWRYAGINYPQRLQLSPPYFRQNRHLILKTPHRTNRLTSLSDMWFVWYLKQNEEAAPSAFRLPFCGTSSQFLTL